MLVEKVKREPFCGIEFIFASKRGEKKLNEAELKEKQKPFPFPPTLKPPYSNSPPISPFFSLKGIKYIPSTFLIFFLSSFFPRKLFPKLFFRWLSGKSGKTKKNIFFVYLFKSLRNEKLEAKFGKCRKYFYSP